jgi:hypothetical protein
MVVLAALLEFIPGNTFALLSFLDMVRRTHTIPFPWLIPETDAWYLTYAATLQPFYNAVGAYATTTGATQVATQVAGQITPGFPASSSERDSILYDAEGDWEGRRITMTLDLDIIKIDAFCQV